MNRTLLQQALADDIEKELITGTAPPKSFAETHPANPNATCDCEHWPAPRGFAAQPSIDGVVRTPAHKYNPAPVYTSNCIRHPAAPHGVDVDASWRAGHTVCVCQSWTPGEAS